MDTHTTIVRTGGKNIFQSSVFAVAFVIANLFFVQHAFAQGWYNTGGTWNYRKAITIDASKVPNTDQSNFPVLVNLNADAGLSAHALASGNDILFTLSDGITKIPYQRESYSGGTLTAWVQVPTVSHTANTIIYMYYGNAAAADQQQATSVWDASYTGVYHLNEPGAGNSGEYKESKSGTINGTVTDQVIKAVYSMTASANSYCYQELTAPTNYTIVSGDTLVYDVYWTSSTDFISFDLTSSDGLTDLRDNGATDQNGLGAHPATDLSAFALNKWYHRVIPIPAALNGKSIGFYDIVCESDATATKTGYITNIYILHGGISKVIYTQGGSTTNTNHLNNNGSITSLGNVTDLTNRSVSGEMGNAVNTDAARFLSMSARSTNVTSNFTLEAWVNPNVLSQHGYFLYNGNQAAGYGFGIGDGTGKLGSKLIGLYGNAGYIPSNFTFTGTGTWNHVVMERSSGGTTSFYVNGVAYTASSGGTITPSAPNNFFTIGNELDASATPVANRYFNGPIDEVRISTTARSSDWIATEYNNQSSPSTFYSLGTETLLGPTITSFTPDHGCANTVSVVITGTNFTGATAVKFGGTDALSFTVNSATQITATPATGTTGTISVTAPIGPTGIGTSASTFTVNAIPLASVVSTNITCFGANDGTITITASGGTAPYKYAASTDGVTFNWITPVPPSTNPYTIGALAPNQPYRIKVMDANGCISK